MCSISQIHDGQVSFFFLKNDWTTENTSDHRDFGVAIGERDTKLKAFMKANTIDWRWLPNRGVTNDAFHFDFASF